MDVQSIFYIVAIVYMIISILILLFILIFLWQTQRKINEFRQRIIDRAVSFFKNKNVEILSAVALGALAFIGNRVKKVFKR